MLPRGVGSIMGDDPPQALLVPLGKRADVG